MQASNCDDILPLDDFDWDDMELAPVLELPDINVRGDISQNIMPRNIDIFTGFNSIKYKRGTPIQNFTDVAVNGTVVMIDGIVFAQRELQRGTCIGFLCPFASKYEEGKTRVLHGDVLFQNIKTGEYLWEQMEHSVHFGVYMKMTPDINVANCCITDDSRIVMLRSIFNVSKSVPLVCFTGNWKLIPN
jgi:hypothetical protein